MTHEEDTPLHRGVEWSRGWCSRGGGEKRASTPWVLPVVPCQQATPPSLAWRKVGGGGVAINHQFKKGSQPPSGVEQGSGTQCGGKKKKEGEEIICYFFRLGWTTAFLGWEGSERVSAERLHMCLYRRSHVHRAIRHHRSVSKTEINLNQKAGISCIIHQRNFKAV